MSAPTEPDRSPSGHEPQGERAESGVLCLLYVPANRPDRILKALAAGSDGVIIDLEDAVPPAEKDAARTALIDVLPQVIPRLRPNPDPREVGGSGAPDGSLELQVRVNAPGTPWHEADVAALAALPGHVGARVPKCVDPTDLASLIARLTTSTARPVHVLLESALGVERAFEIASVAGVTTLGMGDADLRADLGVSDEQGLLFSRARVVNAAAAAGLPAPLMAAYSQVRDLEGLARSSRLGRALGFRGRSAIHPSQLPTIREVFTPSAQELAAAQEVITAAQDAEQAGSGALLLADGRFVDVAVVRQARRVVAAAARLR